jgi:general stress protein CsbA
MVVLDGNFAVGCGPETDYSQIHIFQRTQERAGTITNEVLEPITLFIAYPIVLYREAYSRWLTVLGVILLCGMVNTNYTNNCYINFVHILPFLKICILITKFISGVIINYTCHVIATSYQEV